MQLRLINSVRSYVFALPENGDTFDIDVVIPNHHLAKGLYKIDMNISKFDYTAFARDHDLVFNVLSFEVKHVMLIIKWDSMPGHIVLVAFA